MPRHTCPERDTLLTSSKDGIGPEVVDAAITVLKTLSETLGSFDIDFTHFDWSSDTYKKTGQYIPDGGLDELKKHDAILFGAVGAPGKYQTAGSSPFVCRRSVG